MADSRCRPAELLALRMLLTIADERAADIGVALELIERFMTVLRLQPHERLSDAKWTMSIAF
jgi:hypothetical protein